MKSNVTFESLDQVQLAGTFFRGSKGADSPTVLMMHKFKGSRSQRGWEELAKTLQDRGFAVLTFDFRGHGGSTSVRDRFWSWNFNRTGIVGASSGRNKLTISVNEFKNNYWPYLVNDIVAARRFLDLKNDAQQCNTSSIFLIGAQEGAALGMLWMVHEWERKAIPAGTAINAVGVTPRNPGEDIAAGVWLGPVVQGPVGPSFRVSQWLSRNTSSGLRNAVPQMFIFGKQDTASAQAVPPMLAAVRRNPDNIRSKHTFDREEALATALPGQELLGNASLGVSDKIVKYIEEILTKQRRAVVWKEARPTESNMFPLAGFGFPP